MIPKEKLIEIRKQLEGLSEEQAAKKLQEIIKTLSPEEQQALMQQQCPFCLIVEGKIPSYKLYEDDKVVAVLDINPSNIGHALIIPKKHYYVISQMKDEEIAHIFNVSNKISTAIFEALKADGTNIFVASGRAAGQNSQHALVHVIPRFENDKLGLIWKPKQAGEEELKETAEKILEKTKALSIEENRPKEKIIRKPRTLDSVKVPERVP